ncbi:MAG: hypothetical protein DIJKHBIC_00029 [Thermoanaerobaculia bacterium]|nr:hypothetical protein [Thermoanaerobaculia bacterium]
MLPRSQYEPHLRLLFFERRGEEFQRFFADLMERCHPGDFQRVCPWGSTGDKKCDGYLSSAEVVFQVYAPSTEVLTRTLAKIREDFAGAMEHWPRMRAWTFVHNAMDGVAPDVLQELQRLQLENPSIRIGRMGHAEIREKAFELDDEHLVALLGAPVTLVDLLRVGFPDLQPVIAHIAAAADIPPDDLRPVPLTKLDRNHLDPSTRDYLLLGMKRAALVGSYFAQAHDPTLGDRIAATFREQYQTLKAQRYAPDDILYQLLLLAGGRARAPARQEAATLAVLAYLFEQCDIFERPDDP